jgi:phosphonopyruvate decarboxylase
MQQVDPSRLLDFVTSKLGVSFFTGVPDSCIASFCAEVDEYFRNHDANVQHVIAANEGAAIGLAVGHHLASGSIPLVYMQNSGLGNAVNPLLSAAHVDVYGIPMILILGWRGAPGEKDEPQHMVMGRQNESILRTLEIEKFILPGSNSGAKAVMRQAHDAARSGNRPVAVLVRPKTFAGSVQRRSVPAHELSRAQALKNVIGTVGPDDAVVATTGFTSRELYELRESLSGTHNADFLCVGSMGHALAIAQGIAVTQSNRTVWCLDGDGAALMHLGSLTLSASFRISNLRHILFNNQAHESVGEQPTVASQSSGTFSLRKPLNFAELATVAGYSSLGRVRSSEELASALSKVEGAALDEGPIFLEVRTALGTRSDLGRPKMSTTDARNAFMEFLRQPVHSTSSERPPNRLLDGKDPLLLTPGKFEKTLSATCLIRDQQLTFVCALSLFVRTIDDVKPCEERHVA